MKIQIVQPVPGKTWLVGHTVLMSDDKAAQLIEDGLAIVHPTVTDPAPTHPCPCEDESHEGPCEDCESTDDPVDEELDLDIESEIN